MNFLNRNRDRAHRRTRRQRTITTRYLMGRSALDGDKNTPPDFDDHAEHAGGSSDIIAQTKDKVLLFLRNPSPLRIGLAGLVLVALVSVPVVLAVRAASENPENPSGTTPLPAAVMGSPSPSPALTPTASPTVSPTPSPTPEPTPTPAPHPSNMVIREGINAPIIVEIQERLMKLGYMENDEPTDYYGSITKSAIRLFQRQHGLDIDGKTGLATYELLMSDQAQNYTVMLEASGVDVRELQSRLRELGYMDDITGYFGEQTKAAVENFQKYNNLSVDGKVGKKTRELLYSASAKAYFMKYGEKSEEVKSYQERLRSLGYLTTTPDGNYGQDTVSAVSRFQELNGIIADGFLGPETISMLKSSRAKANALMFGMSGKDVENIQKRLKSLGYMSHVTGYFGSETESAVQAFQKRNSLSVDGTVGKVTMTTLTSSGAKKASSGNSGGSGSNGGSGGGSNGGGNSGGSSNSSSSASNRIESFIAIAQSKLGSRYVFASKGPDTFDCSGFIYYALNQAGVKQSYMTSQAWSRSTKYQRISSTSDLKRGDILVFDGHVGIYLGNGGMIDASSSKGKVVTRSGIWSSSYWNRNFIVGFRIF